MSRERFFVTDGARRRGGLMSIPDPHAVTSRLASKSARGHELTDAEQAEIADARKAIMDTPEMRSAEAEIQYHMDVGFGRDVQDLLAKLEALLVKLAPIDDEAAP